MCSLSYQPPVIIAVHIPRFSLLIALLRARRPLDAPVALGPEPGAPQVVGESTAVAEAQGVEPGLRVGEALARCPSLELVVPDPAAVAEEAEVVICRLEELGATVEPGPPGQVCFSADGLLRLHGGLEPLLRRTRAALPVGAGGRVGTGPGRFVAIEAARSSTPDRPLVLDGGEVSEFLAPLPISRLVDDADVSPDLVSTLKDLGITTLGRLAELPVRSVGARLGPAGHRAHQLARGTDDLPLIPRTPPAPLEQRFHFPEPVGARPALRAAARLLLGEVAASARARGRAIRALELRARLEEGGSWSRALTLRDATADPKRLETAALPSLDEVEGSVEELRLRVDASGSLAGHQLAAIRTEDEERSRRAGEAIRQVRTALGDEVILRAVEVEPWSRLPERRWALVPYDN
jgi:protein ImuB